MQVDSCRGTHSPPVLQSPRQPVEQVDEPIAAAEVKASHITVHSHPVRTHAIISLGIEECRLAYELFFSLAVVAVQLHNSKVSFFIKKDQAIRKSTTIVGRKIDFALEGFIFDLHFVVKMKDNNFGHPAFFALAYRFLHILVVPLSAFLKH